MTMNQIRDFYEVEEGTIFRHKDTLYRKVWHGCANAQSLDGSTEYYFKARTMVAVA